MQVHSLQWKLKILHAVFSIRPLTGQTKGRMEFEVSDQGIGIPTGEISHLFEPFHRASNVGDIPGTGMGLAIVKNSVDLHRGTIHVSTPAGGGTTFLVSI